jgi:hypothetical protein
MQYEGEPFQGFTSNYAVVSKKLPARKYFNTDAEFKDMLGSVSYYPADEDEINTGDEIIAYQPEQVLPKYVVHYTVHVSFHS